MIGQVPLRVAVAIAPACILAVIVFMAGYAFFLIPYNQNVAYPAYIESLAMDPGDVGGEPVESTPKARSVADMEAQDIFFVTGDVITNTVRTIDNRNFYFVTLDSGECLAALINFEHAEEVDVFRYRLPVGRLAPLKLSSEGQRILSYDAYRLTRSDCYIDMVGDFGRTYSEVEYREHIPAYRALEIGRGVVMLGAWFFIWRFFTKKNWF